MSNLYAGNKGLANLGNTCYMNSALQCLSHLKLFNPNYERFFNSCKIASTSSLMYEWFQFQRKMWKNTQDQIINPIELLKRFNYLCNEKNIEFNNFQQNDIDEFLVLFLDLLHESIKKEVQMTYDKSEKSEADKISNLANKTWKDFYEKSYSYIIENFYSQLLTITSCPECNYYTTSHDPLHIISLELTDDCNNLEDCMKNYTIKKQLDNENKWKCDNCRLEVCPFQKTILWRISDVIMILLKQYKNDNTKISKIISFPIILDMNKYSLNKEKSDNFELKSIGIHSGGTGGGHYYAACKNYLNGKWYRYNDTSVNEISTDELLNYSPYLLVYSRLS